MIAIDRLGSMKHLFFAALFIFTAIAANAQQFDGVVKDAKTLQALPYVNVGIIGKSVGTVTDNDGRFKLTLAGHEADSIRISMIGYDAQSFLVSDFVKNTGNHTTTLLRTALNQLKEVKVNNRKWKQAILGNTTKSQGTTAGFSSNMLGNEIGTLIRIKRSPTFLKEFNASIAGEVTDSAKLRLNFYSVKNGLPDQLLQNENIFITVKKGDRGVHIDLQPYNVIVEDNFIVTLEWIKNSRGHGIMFSGKVLGGSVIARETSQANWEKVGIVGLGFNVLAEY